VLLLLGAAWVVFSLIVPQLGVTSLRSVSVLLGIVLLAAAASELPAMMSAAPDRRWSHALLAVAFAAAGVVALVWPSPTFAVVARIVGWALLVKGTVDILHGFMARRAEIGGAAAARGGQEHPEPEAAGGPGLRGAAPWWAPLCLGVFELGLAFWAVSYPGYSLTLLLLWIGLTALTVGLSKIATAMRPGVREAAAEGPLPPTGFGAPAVGEAARTEGRLRRPTA
jgi:uncharacterized membrane protein HdeD (DUF308 family)